MSGATFLYLLIETIIFILPIATLFFKSGRMVQRIETLEKEVNEDKEKNEKTIEKITDTLEAMNDKLTTIQTSIATIEVRLTALEKKNDKE